MIGTYYRVLDKGFLALKDVMGDDSSIEEAARVSYQKGTRKISDTRNLIRYLMRRGHSSPFEQVEFKFHVKLPIFVARQWIRHRTASVNEISGRYSELKTEYYLPSQDNYNLQSTTNKQGRSDELITGEVYGEMVKCIGAVREEVTELYDRLLGQGVARELARIDLPLSIYTEWYWKCDLRNIFNFLKLRLDTHAQKEIRDYANVMAAIVRERCPLAYEAFEDYVLNSKTFTATEVRLLQLPQDRVSPKSWLKEKGYSDRETEEYLTKLDNHTIVVQPLHTFPVFIPEELNGKT